MADPKVLEVEFDGRKFINTERGVKEKLKRYLKFRLLTDLEGLEGLETAEQDRIIEEIIKGCGSSLPLVTSTKCSNLRMFLDVLGNLFQERLG
jgi:hypothetical protein